MKLLLDENLPRSIAPWLGEHFVGSTHVAFLDLLSASDFDVWQVASVEGYAILTKDRDFADRVIVHVPPPKVIWLRLGNCTVGDVRDLLERAHEAIAEFVKSEFGLLVLPSGFRAG